MHNGSYILAVLLATVVSGPVGAAATSDWDLAQSLIQNEKWDQAIDPLNKELDANPGHEAAYLMLIEALDKSGRRDEAIDACKSFMKISHNETHRSDVRKTMIRLTRQKLEQEVHSVSGRTDIKDPFHINMPEITDEQWERLKVVEDTDYTVDPELGIRVPPITWNTEHFRVFACNEEWAKVTGERAEIYLDFMSERLFGNREWAFRLPIMIYKDENDYISVGGAPQGSHGVTSGEFFGRSQYVMIFQLIEVEKENNQKETTVYKYALESIIPHELTHVMLNEFFGMETPQWLHEAVAGRMEQTREHYLEAARLARSVVSGEYFRMRDLFEQEGYPARVSLFYEQAAITVLFLFEEGPDSMYAFFTELANHPKRARHDYACAAVLGIPAKGAVEEFEKQWVRWMTARYRKDLEKDIGEKDTVPVTISSDVVFQPQANEMDTVSNVSDWRTVDLGNLNGFIGVGGSKDDWRSGGGRLTCDFGDEFGPSFLGIRMKEDRPLVVQCDVRLSQRPANGAGWIGFNQFNADNLDTDVNVLAEVRDTRVHKLTAVLADELALYMDGECVARMASFFPGKDSRDIDYPLAIVTYAPIEISNLRVAEIKEFTRAPVAKSD